MITGALDLYTINDGESAFIADIDNEMSSVACDSSGKTENAFSVKLKPSAFYGSTNVTSDCKITEEHSNSNIRVGITGTTSIEVSVAKGVAISGTNDITFTFTHPTYGTRTAVFTLLAVPAGSDGKPATTYDIIPSLSSISFARQTDGTLTPSSRALTANIRVAQGDTISDKTISASGLTVRYSTSSMPTSKTAGTPLSDNGFNIESSDTYTNVYIAAFLNDTCVDRETIPIVKDGANGEDGSSYTENLLKGTRTWKGWDLKNNAATLTEDDYEDFSTLFYNNGTGTAYKDIAETPYTFEPETVYTLSFWAKGSQIRPFCYSKSQGSGTQTHDELMARSDGGELDKAGGNGVIFALTSQWQRFWFTFKTVEASRISTNAQVLFRVQEGQNATVCGVKLEKGSNPHPVWSPHHSDMEGDSPLFADLTNEMDSVACNINGEVENETSLTTIVSMWDGSTQLDIAKIEFLVDGNMIGNSYANAGAGSFWKASGSTSTGVCTITVKAGTMIIGKENITIRITSSISGENVNRDLTFTVNGIRPGKEGEPAVVYRLSPSVNNIVLKKDGTYVPSGNVTCSVLKATGGKQEAAPSSEYVLKKIVNGGGEVTYSATPTNTITSNLKFNLYVQDILVDTETIPLISDGDKGDKGDKGDPGKDAESWIETDINYRGEWKQGETYLYVEKNTQREARRDFVFVREGDKILGFVMAIKSEGFVSNVSPVEDNTSTLGNSGHWTAVSYNDITFTGAVIASLVKAQGGEFDNLIAKNCRFESITMTGIINQLQQTVDSAEKFLQLFTVMPNGYIPANDYPEGFNSQVDMTKKYMFNNEDFYIFEGEEKEAVNRKSIKTTAIASFGNGGLEGFEDMGDLSVGNNKVKLYVSLDMLYAGGFIDMRFLPTGYKPVYGGKTLEAAIWPANDTCICCIVLPLLIVSDIGDNTLGDYIRTPTTMNTGRLHYITFEEMTSLIGRKMTIANNTESEYLFVFYGHHDKGVGGNGTETFHGYVMIKKGDALTFEFSMEANITNEDDYVFENGTKTVDYYRSNPLYYWKPIRSKAYYSLMKRFLTLRSFGYDGEKDLAPEIP